MKKGQTVEIPNNLYTILQYMKVVSKRDIKDLVIDAITKTYNIDKIIKSSSISELERLMNKIK